MVIDGAMIGALIGLVEFIMIGFIARISNPHNFKSNSFKRYNSKKLATNLHSAKLTKLYV